MKKEQLAHKLTGIKTQIEDCWSWFKNLDVNEKTFVISLGLFLASSSPLIAVLFVGPMAGEWMRTNEVTVPAMAIDTIDKYLNGLAPVAILSAASSVISSLMLPPDKN